MRSCHPRMNKLFHLNGKSLVRQKYSFNKSIIPFIPNFHMIQTVSGKRSFHLIFPTPANASFSSCINKLTKWIKIKSLI